MQIFLIITAVIFAAACGILSVLCLSQRRRLHAQSLRIGEEEARTAAETARSTELAGELRARELDLVAARKDIEALTARLDEEGEKLKEKNEMLMLQFEKTANDIFERKTRQFKDVNKESLDIILKPLKDNISDFKQRVEEIYSEENENRGALKAELNSLMELNRRITEETNNLTSALRGNSKVQGDWGEMILDTILESSNLQKGIHYTTQTNVKDAEGNNLRRQSSLNLPDGKRVVIDFQGIAHGLRELCACEEEESRRRTMRRTPALRPQPRQRVGPQKLPESVLGSPDFVIMFIPTEPAFLAAVQYDNGLWDEAYRKKVIISSPTNLFGMLKIVDDLWKRDDLGRNANRIAREGAMMYDKFVGFVTTLETIGKNIDTMQGNYDKAMKQLRTGTGNLVSRAQRLSALNIKVSKSLPSPCWKSPTTCPSRSDRTETRHAQPPYGPVFRRSAPPSRNKEKPSPHRTAPYITKTSLRPLLYSIAPDLKTTSRQTGPNHSTAPEKKTFPRTPPVFYHSRHRHIPRPPYPHTETRNTKKQRDERTVPFILSMFP